MVRKTWPWLSRRHSNKEREGQFSDLPMIELRPSRDSLEGRTLIPTIPLSKRQAVSLSKLRNLSRLYCTGVEESNIKRTITEQTVLVPKKRVSFADDKTSSTTSSECSKEEEPDIMKFLDPHDDGTARKDSSHSNFIDMKDLSKTFFLLTFFSCFAHDTNQSVFEGKFSDFNIFSPDKDERELFGSPSSAFHSVPKTRSHDSGLCGLGPLYRNPKHKDSSFESFLRRRNEEFHRRATRHNLVHDDSTITSRESIFEEGYDEFMVLSDDEDDFFYH